jgi:ribosomal protein S30
MSQICYFCQSCVITMLYYACVFQHISFAYKKCVTGGVMALREERNEQNSQAWRAHFERERLDLSASVEAALMDDGRVLAAQWDEDIDEQDASQPVTGGTGLVPPRLSLQSKMLPAVQPERIVTTTTDAYRATSSPVVEQAELQSAQSSGMLARLARRFTSSFTAVKPELPQQQAPFASSTQAFNQPMMETYQSMPAGKRLSAPAIHADPPLVRVIDTIMSPDPVEEETRAEPPKHRSLKRNGKVRLQTTEQPAITRASLFPRVEEQETDEALLADVRDALNEQQASSRRNAAPVSFVPAYGSGAFESEQRDVMIANALVTAATVVLVTLTTNPGPVVVQYISLQPRVGFTVHLTAPVATRTAFNYVLLLGEML